MKNAKGKIGIGILTHNRPDIFQATLKHIKATLPAGAKLVIVDDASTEPVEEATFRFDQNVGIATGKNKCIELLADCEHIFLFDDDCYPRRNGWHVPYVKSPEPHLMYLFKDLKGQKLRDSKLLYQDADHFALSHPRGCMLYLHRSVLDVAGGMDTTYCKWGFEHGDLSNRIYNLGMTSFRFMDVTGSDKLIYSGDEEMTVKTTVKGQLRHRYLAKTRSKYDASFTSTAYFPYKKGAKRKLPKVKADKDVVITSFFNAQADPQRGKRWLASYGWLDDLRITVNNHRRKLVIINNCFKGRLSKPLVEHVRVPQGCNPYFQRWLSQWQYLRSNPDIKRCFLVDATDVQMLNDPFPHMKPGVLYVGDEKNKLGCPWMRTAASHQALKEFIAENYKATLFNCGVVGGDRETVMQLCRAICERYFNRYPTENVEMPIFNEVVHTWPGKVEFGRHVTTLFKKYEGDSEAWFKHK